jgi:hypothetical protein
MAPKTDIAVHHNENYPYVMAYLCTCGVLAVAFGTDAYGLFSGTCVNGHKSDLMAS